MTEVVIALTGLFCTTVSSIITFLLTKRKYNTEVDSQQIDNMNKSFEVYKKMMEEAMESQEKAMKATIDALNMKINELEKENGSLRQQVNHLQMQLISLVGNIHANPGIPTGMTPEVFNDNSTDKD